MSLGWVDPIGQGENVAFLVSKMPLAEELVSFIIDELEDKGAVKLEGDFGGGGKVNEMCLCFGLFFKPERIVVCEERLDKIDVFIVDKRIKGRPDFSGEIKREIVLRMKAVKY